MLEGSCSFSVMGRKGKRVHEQSVGSTVLTHDYETIKVVPAQKQESGLGLLLFLGWMLRCVGRNPLGLWALLFVPYMKSVNIVPFPAVAVMTLTFFIGVNSM